jgi:hypothetical protein
VSLKIKGLSKLLCNNKWPTSKYLTGEKLTGGSVDKFCFEIFAYRLMNFLGFGYFEASLNVLAV